MDDVALYLFFVLNLLNLSSHADQEVLDLGTALALQH